MSTARKTRPQAAAPPSEIATATPHLLMFDVARIDVGKTNPRKSFDKAGHDELTDSVRKDGILQPLLVRPSVDGNGMADSSRVELVAGERRLRAAKAAGLAQVPVIVRQLSDLEVIELQLVENLQRQDLSPLEEADAYQQLREKHGLSTAEIAAKVKRSERSVLAVLQLTKLPKVARELLSEGALDTSRALLISRIPVPDLADAAARLIAGKGTAKDKEKLGHYIDEPMSFRQARDLIARRCCMRLTDAPFAVADAQLVPKAGACTACPKRTGYQPELFADLVEINGKDSCTDPGCFDQKRDAQWARESAAARAKGLTVAASSAGLVTLSDRCWKDSKHRTWKELLGKDAPAAVLVRTHEGGVEMISESAAMAVLKRKGVKLRSSSYSGSTVSAASKVNNAKRMADAELGGELDTRVRAAVVARPIKADELMLRFTASRIAPFAFTSDPDFRKRYGLKGKDPRKDILALVAKVKAAELPRLIVDLLLHDDSIEPATGEKLGEALTLAAATFGVDVREHVAAARAAVEPKPKAPAKAKPKPKAAGKKGRRK